MEKYKRLTEMTTSGGWAAKIGPEVLASVLSQLPKNDNDNINNLLILKHHLLYTKSLLENLWFNHFFLYYVHISLYILMLISSIYI